MWINDELYDFFESITYYEIYHALTIYEKVLIMLYSRKYYVFSDHQSIFRDIDNIIDFSKRMTINLASNLRIDYIFLKFIHKFL